MRNSQTQVDTLLLVAVAAGYLPTVGLYAYAAPTADLRARLPILLIGAWSLALLFAALYFAVALAGLWLAGLGWTKATVGAALLGAIGNLVALESGLGAQMLPAVHDDMSLFWLHSAFWVAVVMVGCLVVWRRRLGRRHSVRAV